MKNLMTIAGIIFGFLSRPCCALPFFYSIFGLGSSSLVWILTPYRHILLAAGVISFGISFYLTFRVRGAVFNKVFLLGSCGVALTFLILPYFGIDVFLR